MTAGKLATKEMSKLIEKILIRQQWCRQAAGSKTQFEKE
jgi:hypothetical protein